MVFTTGQLIGMGAFTAAVLVIGALLLKLDTMIGTNYDIAEEDASAATQTSPQSAPATAPRVTSRLKRRR